MAYSGDHMCKQVGLRSLCALGVFGVILGGLPFQSWLILSGLASWFGCGCGASAVPTTCQTNGPGDLCCKTESAAPVTLQVGLHSWCDLGAPCFRCRLSSMVLIPGARSSGLAVAGFQPCHSMSDERIAWMGLRALALLVSPLCRTRLRRAEGIRVAGCCAGFEVASREERLAHSGDHTCKHVGSSFIYRLVDLRRHSHVLGSHSWP